MRFLSPKTDLAFKRIFGFSAPGAARISC